jgi:hypothetical protein
MGRRNRIEQRRWKRGSPLAFYVLCISWVLALSIFITSFEVSKCGVELLRFSWTFLGYHFMD